jgi:UDP-2-acetamido-2-deoxy-ribo-hexuluronate aminotransferase
VIARRREIAGQYDAGLREVVQTPIRSEDRSDVYYTYTIQADQRDELKSFLEEHGIETKIQHPYLMPDQPAYAGHTRAECDNARRLQARILCIPASEKLEARMVDYVIARIREFYGR